MVGVDEDKVRLPRHEVYEPLTFGQSDGAGSLEPIHTPRSRSQFGLLSYCEFIMKYCLYSL